MTRKAFTLVELLVVIGIIALLIGLLMPAMARARERSRATVCLSQMRQVGLGVIMYANVNRGWFPQNSHAGADQSWIATLYIHGVPPIARLCPSDLRDPLPGASSYATNNYTVAPRPYTRVTTVRRPCDTIYAAETLKTGDHLHATGYTVAADLAREIAVDRHLRSANYLYCDGHAESVLFEHFAKNFSVATSPFDPRPPR